MGLPLNVLVLFGIFVALTLIAFLLLRQFVRAGLHALRQNHDLLREEQRWQIKVLERVDSRVKRLYKQFPVEYWKKHGTLAWKVVRIFQGQPCSILSEKSIMTPEFMYPNYFFHWDEMIFQEESYGVHVYDNEQRAIEEMALLANYERRMGSQFMVVPVYIPKAAKKAESVSPETDAYDMVYLPPEGYQLPKERKSSAKKSKTTRKRTRK